MKNEFVIVTDSTTDLPQSIANELGLIVLPLKYNIANETYANYLDYREQDVKDFYDLVRKGNLATTSQLVPEEYIEALSPILESGKDVLILSFSSKLSGTYNSARLATIELQEKFPERKIISLDTKSASLGEGFLVYLTAKEKQKGLTIEEAVEFVNKTMLHVAHWFTVDDINHLRRGGRISAVSSFVAKALNIKPVMHTDNEGALIPRQKAVTRKRAIKALFTKMEETALPDQKIVFIGHGDDLEAAKTLEAYIKEKYPKAEVLINTIGPVIGAHTGQGVLALFFLATER
ncbi:DegV family protein [Haploplasma axanthum]|uniref:EDD domain-containing protein, DegV family n=1 Tax=Haploplasma axanthum TaxID=29552 RepID=A0A449BDW1_HAPAX|nr:DegV family protein [Haploplasma axanthum]VEU80644.1 EDD domain-containing protein, DegV family [Haploplasma axanthum]